jgi:hypothetical protein
MATTLCIRPGPILLLGNAEKEYEVHHGSSQGGCKVVAGNRHKRRVESVRRVQMRHSLRLMMTPSCGRNHLEFKLAGNWRHSEVFMRYPRDGGRKITGGTLIVLCVGGGDTEGSPVKAEEVGREIDEKIQTVASTKVGDGIGDAEGFLDVPEKIDALDNLELQPTISRRGWLSQLQMAFGDLAGFLPFIPVQVHFSFDVYMEDKFD